MKFLVSQVVYVFTVLYIIHPSFYTYIIIYNNILHKLKICVFIDNVSKSKSFPFCLIINCKQIFKLLNQNFHFYMIPITWKIRITIFCQFYIFFLCLAIDQFLFAIFIVKKLKIMLEKKKKKKKKKCLQI